LGCTNCVSRRRGICAVLNGRQLPVLNAIARRKTIPAGQHIFSEGGGAERYAVIASGVVKLTRSGLEGQRYIIGLKFASDFLGRIFKPEHAYTAEAATDAELCVFSRDSFVRQLSRSPKLERQLFKLALNELDACREWTLLVSRRSAYQRTAGFLHLLAVQGGARIGNSAHLILPVRREEIADFLGLTLETVSRQMTLLKKNSLIKLVSSREVIVPDVEKLGALARAEIPQD
jgi:CRP/FNR family transcriptional regulator